MLHRFVSTAPFELENGTILPQLEIAYHTYGEQAPDGSNVVWVCHALTANSDAAGWWPGLIGAGAAITPEKHFIVCANILGSCYGSTGPNSVNPATGKPWNSQFPLITIRDMVKAHILLREHLQINTIALCMGGSMGGYQAMEWALAEPAVIKKLFLAVTSAAESAWGIAIHEAQRMAIEADASWTTDQPAAGSNGLKAARAIGMLTYRNYTAMVQQQSDEDSSKLDHFKAASYIRHQGDKLAARFTAQSYWILTKSMDSHNISRERKGDIPAILATIQQPALVLGITSDLLCPTIEQRKISASIPGASYIEIDSMYGHDGFLVEAKQIGEHLQNWLEKK
ncbi:homoserine O-acetyltransferase MetX [Flavihumibacter fluvii]|uniref:homoserine O-acetyltransferase MetX n=1 Tax=Flavihumibacter fluvii TaxID=2838157 RepID=UPI001BDF6186|nr:homoserine O-acetyltransferase [Flavihumibacter fluvii]ULQ52854.1 homoserine O-acetyltransferase [Flavihumibacter fluvii]